MNANFLRSSEKASTHLARTAAAALALALLVALMIVATPAAQAQTFQVIHTFNFVDGSDPRAGLTIDAAGAGGALYGTTRGGGITDTAGTVFKLRRFGSGWVLATLYTFQGGRGVPIDGAWPWGGVAIAPDGTLYGTTSGGGSDRDHGSDCNHYGCGTVFHLTPPAVPPRTALQPLWNGNMLWAFHDGSNGADPQGDLIFDQAGNLYGTTYDGAGSGCGGRGCGVVYQLSPPGGYYIETVLSYAVANPSGGVVFAKSGNLYGVESWSAGAVYQLTPSGSGWTAQTIRSFSCGSDGCSPKGGLIIDASGNLYGTTSSGGSGGGGTVFELTPTSGGWTFTTLYSFSGPGGCLGEPSGPQDKLFMDAVGNLYGTTYCDGAYNAGSVFKLTPSNGGWIYTSLHDFTGGDDGEYPISSLVMDAKGNLYGTASQGGASGNGVVYEITP
jgi:uncharacterized repeat protein (TIGR03803 family)